MSEPLNVVLVEPEIPQNTGSIGRLCLAMKCRLHLVEPFGFELSDRTLKRAGLDYWQHLDVKRYPSLEAFLETIPASAQRVLFSKKAGRSITQTSFEEGSYLFFGKETAGLPEWFLDQYAMDCSRLPMKDARVRSLNLAMCVGIAVFEASRQIEILD